jgi:hypothetical protein
MRKILVISLIFVFLCNSALADISITVQGENSKDVQIVALNQTVMGNLTNGQNLSMPYDNYIVSIVANNTNTLSFFNMWGFFGGLSSKWAYFVVIIFIFFVIYYAARSYK